MDASGYPFAVEKAAPPHLSIEWPEEKPADWTEWEAIIRDITRHWTAPTDVSIARQGNAWRIASVVLRSDPREPAKDNQRRHRITEGLRARGKPAGLGA
jgi:hypothetical protein